jgi:hypothetical protein
MRSCSSERAAAALAALLVGCSGRPEAARAASAPAANFTLDCAPSNTDTAAQLFCVRTDTRSGEVKRVSYLQVPVVAGSATTASAEAGTFQTECAATSTPQRSDFYCLRLNVVTGEIVLVNLQKSAQIP